MLPVWLLGGAVALTAILLSGCNSSENEKEKSNQFCKNAGWKPYGCKPIDPERIEPLRENIVSRIKRLKEGNHYSSLKNLDAAIEKELGFLKRNRQHAIWCYNNPIEELKFLKDLRPRIQSGEEQEFGLRFLLNENDKTEALSLLDSQITHQKGRIAGTIFDERDVHCPTTRRSPEELEKEPLTSSTLRELQLDKKETESQIGYYESLLVDPSEFDPEELGGPLKEVIPAGETPVYVKSNRCFSSCDSKYGTKLDHKIAHASPLAFSHERHLPHLEKDMKKGSLGCAYCHSDGMGTFQDHIKGRMVVVTGKDEKDKDKLGILIGDTLMFHEPSCANCHSNHGRCSTCHDIYQEKRSWPLPFTAPWDAQFEEYDIVEKDGKAHLEPR